MTLIRVWLSRLVSYRHVCVSLELEPRDLWVGVYWTRSSRPTYAPTPREVHTTDVYVCLLPCLPIHLSVQRAD